MSPEDQRQNVKDMTRPTTRLKLNEFMQFRNVNRRIWGL